MDDLIKRLHHYANGDCDMTPVCSTLLEAADHIEQFVATNEALTAKLAKAMEALRYYADASPVARAVLAELEE